MTKRAWSHTICSAAIVTCCLLPSAALANQDIDNDIDYSKTDNTILGHALYARAHENPMKSIGILLNANMNNTLGKDRDLALIFLGDQLNERGLKKEALDLYYEVIQEGKRKKVTDSARLHYAKVKHDLEQYQAAYQVAQEIDDSNLSNKQEVEYRLIKAHALLRASEIDDAIDALPSMRNNSLWALYQRYNFGSELLGTYNNKHGAAVLHQLSNADDSDNPEILALKDQSNLVLGFSLLKINKPEKARSYFQKVRLNGLMSSMALLGMGWSYAVEENYEKSLVYWLELQTRSLGGAYSYESSLAIPYAFGRANAYQQSISYYKAALNRFEADIASMETAKPAIDSKLFLRLLSHAPEEESAWIQAWHPSKQNPESLFLPLFMDNPEFQHHLKEYRNLLSLKLYATSMIEDINSLEQSSGGTLKQLRHKHQLLIQGIGKAINAKEPVLQQLALNVIEGYQTQLNDYLQQTRLGMAQVIEKATLELELE